MDREMYRMTVEPTVMQTDRQAGEQTDIEKDGCTTVASSVKQIYR